MGGGKGGSQNTTTTSTQNQSTNIPDWLTGASQQAVQMGQQIAGQQYNPYTGQMVAGRAPDTTQAYGGRSSGLQGSGQSSVSAIGIGLWRRLLGWP